MTTPIKILICYFYQKKASSTAVDGGSGDTIAEIGDGKLNAANLQDIRAKLAYLHGDGYTIVFTSITRLDTQ